MSKKNTFFLFETFRQSDYDSVALIILIFTLFLSTISDMSNVSKISKLPSSRTANKSSNSSQSTVKRFSTKNPRDFFDHRTANGFRAEPGFNKSITCKMWKNEQNQVKFQRLSGEKISKKNSSKNLLIAIEHIQLHFPVCARIDRNSVYAIIAF